MRGSMFIAAVLAAFSAVASAGDERIKEILAEAEKLAAKGLFREAAFKAAEGDIVKDASMSFSWKAKNASMDYWQKAAEKNDPSIIDTRKLRVNSLFQDHAVLQRDAVIPVWGYAEPNRFVTVGFAGEWLTSKSSDNGYFVVHFPRKKAGGPYTLEVIGCGEHYKFNDIYVGEVWIAGGQSNMEMPLTGYGVPVPEEDRKSLVLANPSNVVRMLKVPRNNDWQIHDDCRKVKWMTDWKGNENVWSAAGLFFAYNLANKLDCPVGIVLCAYSGSRAEAWASAAGCVENTFGKEYEVKDRAVAMAMDCKPHCVEGVGSCDPNHLDPLKFFKRQPRCLEAIKQGPEGREKPEYDDSSWKEVYVPSFWRNNLTNCNGVAWYRKWVEIPRKWAGKELLLSFGSIDKHDVTYFNGVKVGATGKDFEGGHWATMREYKVPASAVKAGKALIAVRVYSFADGCGIFGPEEKMFLSCGKEKIPLAGKDWRAKLTVNIGERWGTSRATRWNPHMMYDNMLSAITPYASRGVIWYQGCSNSGRPFYDKLMERIIFDWRAKWGDPDLAFIQVVLAGFDPGKGYERVRECQMKAAKASGTHYVSAVDGWHANIHPPYKKTLGERLAKRAFEYVYKLKGVESDYPEFKSVSLSGGIATVSFDHAEGLHTSDGGEVKGFDCKIVVTEDRRKKTVLKPLKAVLDGETVKVTVPEEVTEIFYAYKPNPKEANLYNAAGHPAMPFTVKLER